jgi:hypothetical protein
MLAPPRVRYLSRGGPGGHCRYPGDQVPPRTSSRSRQKVRHAKSHALACDLPRREPHDPGQLRGRHVSSGLSSRYPARGSSEATTCLAATAPAARPGAALGPPRVLRPQLPLPSLGQLRGRHVSCGLSSRCPARGSSRVATCALEAERSACYLSNRYPLSVTIMITFQGVCASSEAPHDKQAPCVCKTCGQGRLQGYCSAAPTHCPYTADRCSAAKVITLMTSSYTLPQKCSLPLKI